MGFVETWRDEGWMIVKRGDLTLEFFLHPSLDPAESWFSCCLRLDDVGAFFEAVLSAGVLEQATGWPRAHRPKQEAWGGTVGALVDPDGTLLRLVQSPIEDLFSTHLRHPPQSEQHDKLSLARQLRDCLAVAVIGSFALISLKKSVTGPEEYGSRCLGGLS
jgi:hypothetical protein